MCGSPPFRGNVLQCVVQVCYATLKNDTMPNMGTELLWG